MCAHFHNFPTTIARTATRNMTRCCKQSHVRISKKRSISGYGCGHEKNIKSKKRKVSCMIIYKFPSCIIQECSKLLPTIWWSRYYTVKVSKKILWILSRTDNVHVEWETRYIKRTQAHWNIKEYLGTTYCLLIQNLQAYNQLIRQKLDSQIQTFKILTEINFAQIKEKRK